MPCGALATAYLRSWIEQAPRVRCVERGTGFYGRIIGVCYLAGGGALDGLELNAAMVRAGWALAYRRYSDDYAGIEAVARARGAGVWGLDFVPPWVWRAGGQFNREVNLIGNGQVCRIRSSCQSGDLKRHTAERTSGGDQKPNNRPVIRLPEGAPGRGHKTP